MTLTEKLAFDISNRLLEKLGATVPKKMGNPHGGSPSRTPTIQPPAKPPQIPLASPPQNTIISSGSTAQAAGVPIAPLPGGNNPKMNSTL